MKNLRSLFPYFTSNDGIYLDNAATNLKLQSVIAAEMEFMQKINANPHTADFDNAYIATKAIEECREKVAQFINCDSKDEIVFTSGTTHSLNQIAFGLKKHLKAGDNVVITTIEHASNLLPWMVLRDEIGFELRYAPLDADGLIMTERLTEVIDAKTAIFSFASCSNTMGAMNDVAAVSAAARAIKGEMLICIDAAQSIAHEKTDVKAWDVDLLAFSTHKMFGPFGLGVMWAKKAVLEMMDPLLYGGGNNHVITTDKYVLTNIPHKFEAGTPNASAIYAFNQVFAFFENEASLAEIRAQEHELKAYARELAKNIHDTDIEVYNIENDSPIILFNIKNVPSQDFGTYLSSKWNISVRTGSHCAKMLCEFNGCKTTVRASFSFLNTKEELELLFKAIKKGKTEWLDAIL
jgi:cysteine desulfurase/selenocysteine lyase